MGKRNALFLLPLATAFQPHRWHGIHPRRTTAHDRDRTLVAVQAGLPDSTTVPLAAAPQQQRQSTPKLKAGSGKSSSTTTTNARAKPKKRVAPQQRQRRGWNHRIVQLRKFHTKYGHAHPTRQHNRAFPGLYQWTRTLRSKYVPPHDDENEDEDIEHDEDDHDNSNNRVVLKDSKMKQLQELGFCWNAQAAAWEKRLGQLQQFHAVHNHCSVPNNNSAQEWNGLGVWVRNQRREHKKLKQGLPSTLTKHRLRALEALDFEWYRSQKEAWRTRYQQLVEFHQEHGHCNVPQPQERNDENDEYPYFELGQWCMNQRTAYRKHQNGISSALNKERIALLEDIQFEWHVRNVKWQRMLDRLKDYHQLQGHVNVAVHDGSNADLRLWLTLQRYYYNCRESDEKDNACRAPNPLTDERVAALEAAIPGLHWKARESNGPSNKDWAQLFGAMRDIGLAPETRPKQHWFEGTNPFSNAVKDTWTEEDLLELWNQESDDDLEDVDDNAWYKDN